MLSNHTIRLDRIRTHWGDTLRVAGSLTLGEVRGHDLDPNALPDGKPTGLSDAFAHYGRSAGNSAGCLHCRKPGAGPVADGAVTIGAKAVWFQLDVIDEAAYEHTRAAGPALVMDRCPAIEIPRLG
ncbi:CoA-binding protein [Streptomyces melanosporofaciens]